MKTNFEIVEEIETLAKKTTKNNMTVLTYGVALHLF